MTRTIHIQVFADHIYSHDCTPTIAQRIDVDGNLGNRRAPLPKRYVQDNAAVVSACDSAAIVDLVIVLDESGKTIVYYDYFYSFVIGCLAASERSMILRRVWPRPTGPSTWKPIPSGPR